MNLMSLKKLIALLGVTTLVAACELEDPEKNEQPDPEEGVFVVDATSDDEWVHLDLDSEAITEDPALWELAFRRSWIVANRDAGVQVAPMDGETLDGVDTAPEAGYVLDGDPAAADDPRSGGEGLVFHDGDDWFDYDMATHALSPKKRVYVVLSSEGRAFAVQFAGFYDTAGTSGFVSFRYKEITAPENPEDPEDPEDPEEPEDPEYPEDAITIDASAEDAWVYFDLDTTEVVDESAAWELAFRRSTIVANGPAGAQVAVVDGASLDEVTEVPEEGLLVDPAIAEELDEAELAFHGESAWYAYDMETHRLSARERVYVVMNAEERAFAVQLLGYYGEEDQGGHPTFRVKELEREAPVEAAEVTIDASAEDTWVYYDLDAGEETTADAGWELAFRRSTIVANGPAGAQVAVVDGAILDEVTEAPAEGFLVDPAIAEELDEAELAFHGESAWYAYDMTTHRLGARERVYVVISSEGAAFAIQMIDYYDAEGTSGFPTFLYKEIE